MMFMKQALGSLILCNNIKVLSSASFSMVGNGNPWDFQIWHTMGVWMCLPPSMRENACRQKKTALFYRLLYCCIPTVWHLCLVCKHSNLTALSPSHSHISNPHPPMSWVRRAAPSTDWAPPVALHLGQPVIMKALYTQKQAAINWWAEGNSGS